MTLSYPCCHPSQQYTITGLFGSYLVIHVSHPFSHTCQLHVYPPALNNDQPTRILLNLSISYVCFHHAKQPTTRQQCTKMHRPIWITFDHILLTHTRNSQVYPPVVNSDRPTRTIFDHIYLCPHHSPLLILQCTTRGLFGLQHTPKF